MSFFDRLRGEGKLHRQGEFTLDVDQAGSKLSRFQFRDDRDFLYHLVGGLFRLGAEDIALEWKSNRLTLRMRELELEPDFLVNLPGALLEENSPRRRLAAAAQALLVHKLVRFDWVGSGKNQLYDYLSGTAQNWQRVRLREIQLEGLPSSLVDRALAELSKRAVYCRKSLRIGDRNLNQNLATDRLGGLPARYQCRPGQPSQLELVVDEMVCPAKSVDTPFAWHGVCYGDFRLDVSLANVVEDELYVAVTGSIESSFAACIEKVNDREVIGGLLTSPAYPWLQPLLPGLRARPLFTDQRGRQWSLDELRPPIYFSREKAPVDLPETILTETSKVMRECLKQHLGPDCHQAGAVVLRQLRRQLNQQEWSQRPPTEMKLPERNWLVRKDFEQTTGRWLMGISDDWASPGGELLLLHQGRNLCSRRLAHSEIAFTCLCEIAESQINELWDDVSEAAWKELEPRWLHSLEELVRGLAEGGPPQGALRSYLVEHLSCAQRPQDSYFSRTVLFQDWHGQPYSLHQLLAHNSLVCIVKEAQEPLDDFMPEATFIRAGSWELALFRRVSALKTLELRYLLEDLAVARGQFRERSQLLPQFGQGLVHFCVRGVELETVRVDSVLGFESWVRCDELAFQIRLENQPLGLGRYRLQMTGKVRKLLDGLVAQARQLPVPRPLDESWQEWAREATVREMAPSDLTCWPSLAHGLVSLEQLQAARQVNWTSGPGSSEFGDDLLLVGLSPARQKSLESQCSNPWLCQDGWFAEQERLRIFLQGPVWAPDFRWVARQPGLWLLNDLSKGRLIFLLRGRKLREEEGAIPTGLRATVDCQGLEDSPPLEEVRERVRSFLRQWLAVPRPAETLQLWREWEFWDSELTRLLRRQPWFNSNRGMLSWEDVLNQPEFFRVPSLEPGLSDTRLFVSEMGVPPGLLDSLQAQHGRGHSAAQTDRLLQEEKRLADQRRRMQEQQKRLSRLRHRLAIEWGEVALSGKADKDCWLLLEDRAVLVHNVPSGLAGALELPDQYRLRRISGQEHAELGQAFRRRFYDALVPLWLARVQAGRLNTAELNTFCEYLLLGADKLAGTRWIPCADGSLTSLSQLKLEYQERGELGYWPKRYALSSGGARVIPILSTPLLLELVGRHCGRPPRQLPKPLLHQDLKMPDFRSVGQVLRALGGAADRLRDQVVQLETRRASFFETLFQRPASTPTGQGKALLKALRRQGAQLTQGAARRELLAFLDKAQIVECRGLWDFREELILSRSALRAHLGDQEPPIEVVLSLLLSLVSAINARSLPFTDEMEVKFLASLTTELVGSWATSGNPGSGEVSRS
jgi:hypothetical protein